MKFLKSSIVALLVFCCLTQTTSAYVARHYCTKPYKPYKFNSQTEVDTYIRSLEIYQKCISDYVKEQQKEIEERQRAIKEAVAEYNQVMNSL